MKENLKKALLLGLFIVLTGIAARNEIQGIKDRALIVERVRNAANEDYEIRILDALTDERGITYECLLDGEVINVGYIDR